MSDSDKIMWTIERDPVLRSTIVVVGLLDRSPDWSTLRATFERGAALLPKFRQVVRVPPFGAGPISWVDDPQFDLDHHLRRVALPGGGDLRTVLDLAAPITSDDFDKARPPWTVTVVDGLADGRAAIVLKLHHTISDGVGGIELADLLFEREAQSDTADAGPARDPGNVGERGTPRQPEAATPPWAPIEDVLRAAAGAVRDPAGAARGAARTVASILRMLQPVTRPLSPVLIGRGLARRFDTFELDLGELRALAHDHDATVNDVFLAGAAGGLARYHERLGAPVPALRVTVPINLRREGDPLGGNRFTPARFVLPIDAADAAARIRTAGELIRRWRDEPSVRLTNRLATVLAVLPPALLTAVFRSMLRNIDVDLVDVPGITRPVRLGGARLERMWAFAPPTGTAVSVTLLSHLDTACVGIEADRAAVSDPALLTVCLVESFAEMLDAVRHEARS